VTYHRLIQDSPFKRLKELIEITFNDQEFSISGQLF
jgi:hypothetical protein